MLLTIAVTIGIMRPPTTSMSLDGKCSTRSTSPYRVPSVPCTEHPTRSASRYSSGATSRLARGAYKTAPANASAALTSSTPSNRTSRRPRCGRNVTMRTTELSLPRRQHSSAPTEKTMRPACVGSHFNSPRRPKTPAIRPTANSSVAVVALHARCSLFAIENVYRDTSFSGRTNDGAQRLCHAAVAADDFTQIFRIDDQLNHRL
jgi:hypothetical protein